MVVRSAFVLQHERVPLRLLANYCTESRANPLEPYERKERKTVQTPAEKSALEELQRELEDSERYGS